MNRKSTFHLALCAFFAALTAAAAQLSVPIGPVPVSLATFAVYLAGGILGAGGGAVSQAVYVLLGAAGLPVFAGFRGGAAVLAGPTGGYLAGYIVCALITGAGAERFGRKPLPLVLSMIFGTLVCYALGTAWFMLPHEARPHGIARAVRVPVPSRRRGQDRRFRRAGARAFPRAGTHCAAWQKGGMTPLATG